MTTVAKSDLQKDLGEYLDRVCAGEEMVVTDLGKPVAKLVPLSSNQPIEDHLDQLIRTGRARGPFKPLTKELIKNLPVIDDPDGQALKALLEERELDW